MASFSLRDHEIEVIADAGKLPIWRPISARAAISNREIEGSGSARRFVLRGLKNRQEVSVIAKSQAEACDLLGRKAFPYPLEGFVISEAWAEVEGHRLFKRQRVTPHRAIVSVAGKAVALNIPRWQSPATMPEEMTAFRGWFSDISIRRPQEATEDECYAIIGVDGMGGMTDSQIIAAGCAHGINLDDPRSTLAAQFDLYRSRWRKFNSNPLCWYGILHVERV
jgi:hypothetical protein